ncbi:aromatic acid exporter family protein [Conexibacter sp. CPCC 206217]|uniref:FUSC family protein n=1 Tax=Conexibacter sp. CPCC 206217 TaxID=3064574 RepID=UPI00271B1849|nr:FUSC family protein [Conexibacter sp. CPCC 206217]MDO8211518.1 FUSC family protein [Conexibacter sp. CPCC 206217]
MLESTRRRMRLRSRLGDLRRAGLPILQATLAAGAAWLIATEVFGHARPFFAPISAIICLGASYVERGRRTVELMVGVTIGIAVGDLLISVIGVGTLQLMVVVALAMGAAVFVGGGPILVAQAASAAILVVTLQPPTEGIYWARIIDAFTGGLVAIGVAILLPVDPLALAHRTVRPLLNELAGALDDVATALRTDDATACERALARARTLDAKAGAFHTAVVAAGETARMAPPRWRTRDAVAHYADADPQLDNAVRNVRVLARGAMRALQLGDHVPDDIPLALQELAVAVRGFDDALSDHGGDTSAGPRAAALRAAARATLVLERTGNMSVSVLVGQVRSTAVDLLRALGLDGDEARTAVRAAAREVAQEELVEADLRPSL